MTRAAVSSGRALAAISSPTKRECGAGSVTVDASDRRGAAFARRGEGGGADGQHLLAIGGTHALDGVAGIDRPVEGVGADDGDDVGDLHDVEQRGDARQHALPHGGGGRDERVIVLGQRDAERGDRLGEAVGVGRAIGEEHLGDAVELGRGLGGGAGVLADHQHMHRGA